MLDTAVVDKYFEKFPKLEVFIGVGTVSLKMARTILDVDRYYMYDMFCELVAAGAIYKSGSNNFRATKELQEYLKERRGDIDG